MPTLVARQVSCPHSTPAIAVPFIKLNHHSCLHQYVLDVERDYGLDTFTAATCVYVAWNKCYDLIADRMLQPAAQELCSLDGVC